MANITGTSGSDFLSGTSGDDHIVGLGQSDSLDGLEGSDRLEGGDGNDSLNDGGGDDLAEGGEGNDTLRSQDGNDILHGGAGDDLLDVYRGSGHSNLVTLTGGAGNDRFRLFSFGTSNFILDAGDGDDWIRMDIAKGDHVFTLGAGVDTLSGVNPLDLAGQLSVTITDFAAGAGGDRLELDEFFLSFFFANTPTWDGNQSPFALGFVRLVQSGTDVIVEVDRDGGGNDYVEYVRLANVSAAALTYHNLDGFNADGSIPAGLTLDGTAGHDTIFGAAGGDTLSGLGDRDTIYAGAGNDIIRGGDGFDELYGEGGNDLIEGGAGVDYLHDGFGDDIVRGGAEGDIFSSNEQGNDLLEGEGGNDHFTVSRRKNDQVTVDGGEGDDRMVITTYGDANLITLIGGAGNDTVLFMSMYGAAQISLGAGADEISLALSDHALLTSGRFVVSDFETGAGGDRLDFDQWLGLVTDWDEESNPFQTGHLRLFQNGADTLLQVDSNGGGDLWRTIGTFTGRNVSAFVPGNLDGFAADGSAPPGLTLIGTAATETLIGGAGADTIEGRGGQDSLQGMGGADLIVGGAENDSLYGGSGDDRLEAGGGHDLIDGGTGADLIYAGDGNDSILINNGADTVWAGAGIDSIGVQTSPPPGGTIAVYGEGGPDTIRLLGSHAGTFIVADGGADADIIEIGELNGTATITLGSGSDRVMVYGNAGARPELPGDVRITDFTAGAGGDWIDLAGSLGFVLVNWDGSNPFDTGHVRLVQRDADTLIRIDRDGSGSSHGFVTAFALSGVGAGSLTAANLGFEPHLSVGPGGYSSLQAAVDAAQDGDTIVIAAGTYVENVNVNKSVAIFGPNQGIAGTGVRGAEAVIDGMLTISAAGVTVDGLKFVGRGSSPLGGHDAVVVLANDFTLTNAVFDAGISANGAVQTPYYSVTGLEISYSLIEGYANGILIGGANTSGSVHHNRFQGDGTSGGVGNGISSWSSHLAIADNVFDNIYSASIVLNPSGPVTVDVNGYVTGNTITNSGVVRPVLVIPTGGTQNFTGTEFAEWFAGDAGQASYAAAGLAFSFDGRGGNDLAVGGDQGDSLAGGSGDDELAGQAGDDRLDGGTGVDTMRGGTGNDSYVVDSAGDVVEENAGEGRDEVRTALATFSLFALPDVENLTATSGDAHDFRGNAAANRIEGGSGNDVLRLYDGGADVVLGGGGDDNIFFIGALDSGDVVNGGGGMDTLVLQGAYGSLTLSPYIFEIENVSLLGGNNTNFGEPGTNRYDYVLTTNDANFAAGVQARINGAALLEGEDFTFNGSAETNASFVVYGGKGVDTLTGGLGNDIFFYAEERFATGDTVNGGAGYDGMFLRGNYMIDFNAPGYTGLFTNIENLTLTSATDERYARGGGTEFDYNLTLSNAIVKPGETLTISGALLMTTETMILDASQESDGFLRLFGGRANDTLKGGANADLIHGNLGQDILTGNGGADTFRYDSTAESSFSSVDQITDFTPGTDKIDLSRIDANTLAAGDQAFAWIGSGAFSGQAGQLRASAFMGNAWILEGDTNGDAQPDLFLVLTLQGPTPLGAGDFIL